MVIASTPAERARSCRIAARLVLVALMLGWNPVTAAGSDEPELELAGMTFVGSREGRNDLLLEAEHARYEPGENVVYLKRMRVRAHGEDGSMSLDMESDAGSLWLETNDFRASGNVRGLTGDGRRFRTSWVDYDREEGLVQTDAPVEIIDANVHLRGGGFRYQVDEQNLRLVGGASVRGQ